VAVSREYGFAFFWRSDCHTAGGAEHQRDVTGGAAMMQEGAELFRAVASGSASRIAAAWPRGLLATGPSRRLWTWSRTPSSSGGNPRSTHSWPPS